MADRDNISIEPHSGTGNCSNVLSNLIDRASELILEKYTLANHGKIQAETDYYLILGKDQLEMFYLEVEFRKLKRICELIQAES